MAALDPVAYLRQVPPFDALPQARFDAAARQLQVAYYPAGTRLAHAGGRPLEHLYVVRKGAVRLERAGQTERLLEEAEVFGILSLLSGEAQLDIVVEEDLLAYQLPEAAARELLQDPGFAGHFASSLAERLRRSLERPPAAAQADLSVEVGTLVRREPLWVEAGASVGEAARAMRTAGVTSVLVRGSPPAILSDRDLRNRVLAEGLGPDTPVAQVASRPLRTLEASTPLYAAWTWLLEQGVHHAPLTRAGEVVGLLSSGDLMRASQYGPVALLRRVERLPSREALAGYARQVAAMAGSLLSGGLEALVIAGLVARLNDALLRRLLSLAERELGPPPAPYAWLVLGSEGRMEQTLLTDQDNALVYADAGAAARPWFQALAERMSADLLAAGFPLCPGGFMARSWHGTLSEWEARFGAWADSPQPQALLEAAVFLDFRRAAGALSLEPLERARTRMRERVPFLRGLARTALDFKPPPLLLLRLRGAQGEVDLKAHGIVPVVGLARCYGLEAGGPQRPTLARLEAAARAGLTDADGVERVAEAYRFLLGLRLRLQLRRPDGTGGARVRLAELTPLERARLKESLHEVRAFQERAERHYQVEG